MKKFFFLFLILFASSVLAASPTVEFDWYQSGDRNGDIITLVETIFDPNITSTPSTRLMYWQFDIDGNVNIDRGFSDFNEDFSDGDLTDPLWAFTTPGNWSIVSGRLEVAGPADENGHLKIDVNLIDRNWNFSWNRKLANAADSNTFFLAQDLGVAGTPQNGMFIETLDAGNTIKLYKIVDGTPTELLDVGTFGDQSVFDINITYHDDNWQVWLDDSPIGSFIDTSITSSSYLSLNLGANANNVSWDDFNFMETTTVDSDMNESHPFATSGTKEICLTAGNEDGNSSVCHDVVVGSNANIDINIGTFDFNYSTGFDVADLNEHIILNCVSNSTASNDINFHVVFNGSVVYSDSNDNNSFVYIPVSANNGDNTGRATCSYNSLNTVSQTKVFTLHSITITLVHEETGVNWDTSHYDSNFELLQMKAYGTTAIHDFISVGDNHVHYSSLADDTLRLDVNYDNGISIFKEYTLSVLEPENEVDACLAPQQSIFEQVFVSSQTDTEVTLNHDITDCYALATTTDKAYENNFAARTFTISDPYVLSYFDGNTKVVLSNLDGGSALEHNLQVLILEQIEYEIDIASDFLAISPIYNAITGENDSNKLKIKYVSLRNTNTALDLKVYSESTILWTHYETGSPNNIEVIFDFNGMAITDQNLLRLVAESTRGDETETKTVYFTISTVGFGNVLLPEMAVAIAVLLVIFGLTLVTTRFAFGWFGLIMILLAITVISLAPGVWWLVFMQGILVIILAYVGFVYKNETSRVA